MVLGRFFNVFIYLPSLSHGDSFSSQKGHKKCDSTALTTCFYTVRGGAINKKRSRMEDWSTLLFLLEYLYETVDVNRKSH